MYFENELYQVVDFRDAGVVVLRNVKTNHEIHAILFVDMNSPSHLRVVKIDDTISADSGE